MVKVGEADYRAKTLKIRCLTLLQTLSAIPTSYWHLFDVFYKRIMSKIT
jgi:hypothetical protein